MAMPTAPKPRIIMPQVPGSGAAEMVTLPVKAPVPVPARAKVNGLPMVPRSTLASFRLVLSGNGLSAQPDEQVPEELVSDALLNVTPGVLEPTMMLYKPAAVLVNVNVPEKLLLVWFAPKLIVVVVPLVTTDPGAAGSGLFNPDELVTVTAALAAELSASAVALASAINVLRMSDLHNCPDSIGR
jgi:hypothetical protein